MNCVRIGFTTVLDTFSRNAQIVLPVAIKNFQDQQIGQGIGLAMLGAGIIAASGIQKELKSFLYSSSPKSRSRWKTAMKLGLFSLGLAITCYGIYRIKRNIFKPTASKCTDTFLFYAAGERKNSRSEVFLHTCDLKGSSTDPDCKARLKKAVKKLASCSKVRKLWEEIIKDGPVTLDCASGTIMPSEAMVAAELREVYISDKAPGVEQLILFELNNLNRTKEISEIGAQQCDLKPDEYAMKMELVEFRTLESTYDISKSCVDEKGWPQSFLDVFGVLSEKTNEDPLKKHLSLMESNGHTDSFRKLWYQKCYHILKKSLKNQPNRIKDEL